MVHAFLLGLIFWKFQFSEPKEALSGSGPGSPTVGAVVKVFVDSFTVSKTPLSIKKPDSALKIKPGLPDSNSEGTGEGSPGTGTGREAGSNATLAEIIARVERQKHYPLLAQKINLSGKCLVSFQIDPQGHPVEIKVSTSSGSEILDEAALDAVRKGSPYPIYSRPLNFWIAFELH